MEVFRYRKIYENMADKESKAIYAARVMYAYTGDFEYVRQIVKNFPEYKRISDLAEKSYIFGAGVYGRYLSRFYAGNWLGIIDNDKSKWGETINELIVCSPDILKNSDLVVVANRYHHEEIVQQLLDMGHDKNCIIDISVDIDERGNRQYFDEPFLVKENEEVFVDVGALNGNTSLLFSRWNPCFKKIYLIEPDPINCAKIEKNLSGIDASKYEVFQVGAGNIKQKTKFIVYGNGGSTIDLEGEVSRFVGSGNATLSNESDKISTHFEEQTIELDRLDDVITDKVTFIKMDIEGAEYSALEGCRDMIKKCKPKMAISVYHKPGDIFDIPELLLGYNSSYCFYLRHYSLFPAETILYAV